MGRDSRDPESFDESEYGLPEGLIEEGVREGRTGMSVEQSLQEIYARPKTFGGSEAGLPGGERPDVETTPVPRLLPGETEEDRR
jgi:hypothetical protein